MGPGREFYLTNNGDYVEDRNKEKLPYRRTKIRSNGPPRHKCQMKVIEQRQNNMECWDIHREENPTTCTITKRHWQYKTRCGKNTLGLSTSSGFYLNGLGKRRWVDCFNIELLRLMCLQARSSRFFGLMRMFMKSGLFSWHDLLSLVGELKRELWYRLMKSLVPGIIILIKCLINNDTEHFYDTSVWILPS